MQLRARAVDSNGASVETFAGPAGIVRIMPHFMDIHTVPGATADDLRKAHEADMAVQQRYGVRCLRYWLNEEAGKVFCLFDAPSAEAANAVHREAHGLLAEKIIAVDEDMVEGFLGSGPVDAAGAVRHEDPARGERDTAIRSVIFTDIVGSTALTQRFGDDGAMRFLAAHDAIVRQALRDNGGREVKHTGDGIMASFVSPAGAVRAACQIQADLARLRAEQPDLPLEVRVGGAVGEPIEQDGDLFGSTVQLAARLCAYAEPGQIVVSSTIGDLCRGKGLHFEELPPAALKGFSEPVAVRAVQINC